MNAVELKLHEYKYFPYELRLAELEVRRILGEQPHRQNGSLHVRTAATPSPRTLERLTYFQRASVEGGFGIVPQQARLEASATARKDPARLRRQQTRYSAHGFHEYRGKFNPQMVRAVTNILGLDVGSRLWDPFCGSGTVLLEAHHQGLHALGTDLNPLAVTIANAKLAAVRADPSDLATTVATVTDLVTARAQWMQEGVPNNRVLDAALGRHWIERLPCSEYLTDWFPTPVLAQLLTILEVINEVVPQHLSEVVRVIFSDIVRGVSWQDPADLRIRRRKGPAPNYFAVEAFLRALRSRVSAVIAAKEHTSDYGGWQWASLGDSSNKASLAGDTQMFLEEGVTCVLSSPPYATALPYVDTQRLSMALLGLATVQEIRQLDTALVGSREISVRNRHSIEQSIQDNKDNLADEVWSLCKSLRETCDPNHDGFRRQNTPSLVYRYFAGMTRAMATAREHLQSGGWLAFIVGPNHASLGGVKFLIDTPHLLSATGSHVGLRLYQMHELDAYSRFGLHSKNSIRQESLLVMQRP